MESPLLFYLPLPLPGPTLGRSLIATGNLTMIALQPPLPLEAIISCTAVTRVEPVVINTTAHHLSLHRHQDRLFVKG